LNEFLKVESEMVMEVAITNEKSSSNLPKTNGFTIDRCSKVVCIEKI